jgi:hypothetical protein
MSRRRARLAVMAATGLLLFASGMVSCAGAWFGSPLERRADHIRVPHERHRQAGVECISCHEDVYDAKDLERRVLPSESKCLECHAEAKEQKNCTMCHTNPKRAAPYSPPSPGILMNHAAHLPRVQEKCETCHTKLPEPLRMTDATPTMASCLACHAHKVDFRDGKCARCHTDLGRYPTKPVSSFSHQGDFVREHARQARAATASCASCHEQTFCSDCHATTARPKIEVKFPERVDRDFIHRNDFLGRHSLEARTDPAMCRRCHGTSFCEDCHRAQGFRPRSSDTRNPHPPGWTLGRSGADFHGAAARRDISSCAACHDEGPRSICVDCHKVGGVGGNPHPPGWSKTRDQIAGDAMCLTCHL